MNIHILRCKPTTTAAEKQQLAALDKYQRRYLKQFACYGCDHSLNAPGCGTFFGEACTETSRINRRNACLAGYKARPGRRKCKTLTVKLTTP